MANEPDRDKRERLDRVRVELTEEHLNPLHAEGVQIVRDGVERLEAPNYAELYRRLGFRLDDLADQCRALLDSTEKVFEESADKLFRDRVGIGLDEAKRWDVIRTFRATGVGSAVPGREDAARARGHAHGHGRRPPLAGERRARRRAAPEEEPARVLRPDRDSRPRRPRHPADGRRRRLARALPRGRPHRALREHLAQPADGGEAPRRRRRHRGLGDAHAAPDGRPGVADEAPRLPPPPRVRARRRDAAPVHGAALLGEAPVRARVPPGRRPDDALEPLRRDPRRRAEDRTGRGRTTSRTSTRASTSPATCARGRSRRSSGRTSASATATTGSQSARPARSSASSGRPG